MLLTERIFQAVGLTGLGKPDQLSFCSSTKITEKNHNFNILVCALLFECWVIFHAKLKLTFSKSLSECQTVWIQIRTDILSVLIWVQTVCKGYQQTEKVIPSKENVAGYHMVDNMPPALAHDKWAMS